MSVEALAIAAIVSEGKDGVKRMLQQGISPEDFPTYDEEIDWLIDRAANRMPISPRVFRRRFEDFDWLVPDESLRDLLHDLKSERAYTDLRALLDAVYDDLRIDNAIDTSSFVREKVSEITRLHSPISDFNLIGGWQQHIDHIKNLRRLAAMGEQPGIKTGLQWIDHHWDGLVNGRFIVVLGRPGEGKTYLVDKFAWETVKQKRVAILFSPEMNQWEHGCRIDTLASADPEIQEALGLKHSFRNRALMTGRGFNLKTYKRFKKFLEDEYGEIHMPTGTNRRQRMTVPFIEAKIEEYQPDLVIVDPIYKLSATKNRQSRIEELSDISDALQDLAEAYNIPIVASNQAHRQQSKRDDAPHKDSSFNSDVPIQEADHVIGVKNISDERRMILRCTKSRFGQDFRFEVKFHPNTGVMKEIDAPDNNYYNGNDDEVEDEELREVIKNASTGKE